MGGIETKPVTCKEFDNAQVVDSTIDDYIKNGIIFEAEEMMEYSWLAWGMYVWWINLINYIDTIQAILDCAISNNIEGSKYGDFSFINRSWRVAKQKI